LDNLTHTLVGAAMAEAGLKKRTALGAATLMIGANFPDIDVLALFFPGSIDVRRGATHGFLALAILPFMLAWLMRAYDRRVRLKRDPTATPANFRQLTILAALAIWTHPTLDFMNVYGMRWLMPFVNKWFYADSLFIVDIYILLGLGAGVWISRKRQQTRPAKVALVALAAYVMMMLGITGYGRIRVRNTYPSATGLMLGPHPVIPWARSVIIDEGFQYRTGYWSLISGYEDTDWSGPTPKGDQGPDREAVVMARAHPEARPFLRWTRFPVYRVHREGPVTVVYMEDLRYPGASWASATVRLP
jgi:inner membrane protein